MRLAKGAKPVLKAVQSSEQAQFGWPSGRQGDHDASAPVAVFHCHSSFVHTLRGVLTGVRGRAGLVVLTGAPGSGKSLLLHRALASLAKETMTVLHCDPRSGFSDFIASSCEALGLAGKPSELGDEADPLQLFMDYLAAQRKLGRAVAVVADDAHEMSEELVSELVLLATWPEIGKDVLQLLLVGLPSLEAVVDRMAMRQLITGGYSIHRLTPLQPEEVRTFVTLQVSASGTEAAQLFTAESVDRIAAYSQGIPRLILTLWKLAMRKARLEGQGVITPELIDEVAQSAAVGRDAAELETVEDAASAAENHPRLMPVATQIPTREEHEMSRLESLSRILKNLQSESPGVEASALISEDGLMIASAMSPDLDESRVGGMTATLLSLGTRAATELRRGDVQEVIVRGRDGYAVMISAGRGVLLLVLANENTKLGLIFFDMREAIKSINKIL